MIEVQIIGTGPVGPQGPQGPEGPGPATDEQVQNAVNSLIAEDPSSVENAVDEYLGDHPTVKGTFSNAAKRALMSLLEKVAYIDEGGQDYLDALEAELFTVEVESISAVYTQSGTVYTTDPLDRLKADLVVTATYVDETTEVLAAGVYTLSGTLTAGTSQITVSYNGKTATFNVTVTAWDAAWSYEDGGLPQDTDSDHWEALQTTVSVTFEPNIGVRFNGSSGTYKVEPKNSSTTQKATFEAIVYFKTISTAGGLFLRTGNGSTGMQAIVGRNGGITMDNAATYISGVTIYAEKNYTVRIVSDVSGDCKTYLDGQLISTVSASAIGSMSNQFMLTTNSQSMDMYVRAVRFIGQ